MDKHDDNGIHGAGLKTNKRKRPDTQETDEEAGSGGQQRDVDGTTKDGRGSKRRSTMIVGNPGVAVEQIDPARTHTSANQHTANQHTANPLPITERDTAEDTPPVVFTTTFPEIERGLPGYIHSKAGELPPFPTPVLLPPWLTESDTSCTPPIPILYPFVLYPFLLGHLSSVPPLVLCLSSVICPPLFVPCFVPCFVLCYLSLHV